MEAGPATTGRTVHYTYDAVYRLTQERIDEPGTANDQTIGYVYDAVGNRLQLNRNGSVTTSIYDANDRLLAETTGGVTATFAYDDNGNLLRRTAGGATDTYAYDAENRLVSANPASGAVSYTYDADGMRTSKTAGGVTTSFLLDKNRTFNGAAASCDGCGDGGDSLAQVLVETTGTKVVNYTYGHDLVNQTRPGTGTRFYLYDGQLSTRQLANTTGSVTDAYAYDAFGVLLAATGSTPNVYLYAGEQLDPNVGFYYLRARYYNPAQGRFITTDPEKGNIVDPVSLHRYLYANGNPVNNWDPSGEHNLPEIAVSTLIINASFAGMVGIWEKAKGKSSEAAVLASLKTFGEMLLWEAAVGGALGGVGLGGKLAWEAAIGTIGTRTAAKIAAEKAAVRLVKSLAEMTPEQLRVVIESLKWTALKGTHLARTHPGIANLLRQAAELGGDALCLALTQINAAKPLTGMFMGITMTPRQINALQELFPLLLKAAQVSCK